MDWNDVKSMLVNLGLPLLGAALPVPGGAAIGKALATAIGAGKDTPEGIIDALSSNTEALNKAREFELNHQAVILRLMVDAEVAAVKEVNATMRSENSASHWPSYSWRPFIGFMFGLYVAAQFILPLFHVEPPKVDAELMLVVGSVLGVASWYRGKAQFNQNSVDNRG